MLHKDNCKPIREAFQFLDLVCLILEILQYIDFLSHKSHNAPFPYPTVHHFVTRICTRVHLSVTKWCIVGYLSDTLWDL